MLQNGFLEEAKNAYKNINGTAAQAIGHKEFFKYFEGEISLDEAIEHLKMQTRRYAKRQLTWFRKNDNINWIFMDNEDNLVLSQKHLFIIPAGCKIVKLLNEGNAEVHEVTDQHARMDHQIEYQFLMRYQLGVLRSNVYGVMQLV